MSDQNPMRVHVCPDKSHPTDWVEAAQHFAAFMTSIGHSPESSPHLQDTPRRFTHMLKEMFHDEPWKLTVFDLETDGKGEVGDPGIIIVKDIPMRSMCAHHFAPFEGHVSIGYIPDKHLVGISKFARAVESFASGPRVQEEIGSSIADFFVSALAPLGICVHINASHTCMTARGVKAHGSCTITNTVRGVFFRDAKARSEVLSLLTS